MVLVAICMVAIIGMAVLSIDLVTLYLARMEAQRSADAAALAAARVISLSGITGDPNNTSGQWSQICGSSGSGHTPAAYEAAQAAASQTVANVIPTVTVSYYSTGNSDCTALSQSQTQAFAINPTVIVQVTRSGLSTLFWQIQAANSVSATAAAEAFNPSNSGSITSGGQIIPVSPRCVKPWMVPNLDPLNPATCQYPLNSSNSPKCQPFVDQATGQIRNPGISLNGSNANGVIGETFWLSPDCHYSGSSCRIRIAPQANYTTTPHIPYTTDLLYIPAQTINSSVAVPSAASTGSLYEQAIAGCDQTTVYQCGSLSSSLSSPNLVDLGENPVFSGDTTNGVTALIHETNPNGSQPDGQDTLSPTGAPSSFPFQIIAGGLNPYIAAESIVSGSSSIATVPVYDYTQATQIASSGTTAVTIVGFLQVFINMVDQYGNVQVTVLNVSGCGNGTNATGTAVAGSSPVPVRLITQQ